MRPPIPPRGGTIKIETLLDKKPYIHRLSGDLYFLDDKKDGFLYKFGKFEKALFAV